MDVQYLIDQGENSAVEFKSADVCPESFAKELVAFANANANGGAILFGVSDDGTIEDKVQPGKFEPWVANLSRNNVIPPLICETQVR